MPVNTNNYKTLLAELKGVKLVAVSKTKTIDEIKKLYDLGQRDFGENYVQELVEKFHALPKDIAWHFIGHLQTNKVKMIADFIHLVHGIDSRKLLNELNRQGHKQNKIINCLLQVHIAKEETKFGFGEEELKELLQDRNEMGALNHIKIMGLMGMASFTDDEETIREEFRYLKSLYDKYGKVSGSNFNFSILSMGMSADYKIAIKEGSNLVRIGSLLFGERVSPLPSGDNG